MRIRYEVLLFLFSAVLVYLGARMFQILYLTKGVDGMCPNCGGTHIKPSMRLRVEDIPYLAFRFAAYRCLDCDYRYHRPRIHAEGKTSAFPQ
jgi:hypothetical protein